MIRVLIWNEHLGQEEEAVRAVHPEGIHRTIEGFLKDDPALDVRTATLADPDCGLTEEILAETDVLIWWGHRYHREVPDAVAARVADAVHRGMGFLPLHSSHMAKPFIRLMGTSCTLKWRDGDHERLWTLLPGHPIAEGIPECIELDCEEMYGERFDIPTPDELLFLGWFSGGEIFRSGCVWTRGLGKVFYFQPGHETDPSYHNAHIQRIITNAVHFLAPAVRAASLHCPHIAVSYEEQRRQRMAGETGIDRNRSE